MKILETVNITHRFSDSDKNTLSDISFSIEEGSFFGIAGPNGSGKSTLLRILSGILTPSGGAVMMSDRLLTEYNTDKKSRIMAVMPAETFMPYNFSVREITIMGRAPHLKWWQEYSAQDEAIADDTLKNLKLDHLADRPLNSLSSGEKQKVFIAQALCQHPKILLLDEPTSHLDINRQAEIFNLLKTLSVEKAITVAVVSHDINLISQYCSSMILLKEGKTVATGAPSEIINSANMKKVYETDVTIYINPANGRPHVHVTGLC